MLGPVRGSAVLATLCGIAVATASAREPAAAPATLAALAPAADARKAIAIGPNGQVYEPDGKGDWVRRQPGGTSVDIVGATAIGGATVIASARNAPPFKLTRAGSWTAVVLAPKAKPIVGSGTRVLAAVNKQIFALDTTAARPVRLADAPARVTQLAASKSRAVIATDKGLYELQAGAWKPIKKAPKTVRSLVSDRWAIVDKGVLDLKTLKTIAWPAGVRIDEATTIGETLVVVASKGKNRELLTLTAKGAKPSFEREDIPLDGVSPVVGVVADATKRVVVATKNGKLAVRASGSWTVTDVREELPAPRPGPAPALSATK